jgi:hypothetical protein
MSEASFLCSHKGMERDGEAKKVVFPSSLPNFPLLTMYEAVRILPNSFF